MLKISDLHRWAASAVGALLLCGIPLGAQAQQVPVTIVNSGAAPIYLSFTQLNHTAGAIVWNSSGSGCGSTSTIATAAQAVVAAGATCQAMADTASGSSRFCAARDKAPADCMDGQAKHLTLVETNFDSSSGGCFGQAPCVWYDISVIPSNCTDALWKKNQCASTGGASYNLPVSLSCAGNAAMPVYTCQGPANTTYGPENYPSQCGNPNATCAVGTSPKGVPCVNGVSAYFYPMFDAPQNTYQPNAVCLSGTLTVNFLAGQ